ncbi:hypothetical protein IGI04_032272 [Brassica rapa subsp. trilocularis]|uniref:Uncharacterized protein n=1 Tax=Brassica rapa subsp. trilocularis TaxID=1813537 RepID=A0ABQ7LYI6_BRACM|nr:hypothetical protein IGI04_032272 [Brassica rapa subsp. trilocularis]
MRSRGDLYFRHEIDRNPSASDAGTFKACATMVTWHEDMEDSETTFSFTLSAEDVIERQGLANKIQELDELFMEAAFPQEDNLLLLTQEAYHCFIESLRVESMLSSYPVDMNLMMHVSDTGSRPITFVHCVVSSWLVSIIEDIEN